MIRHATPRTDTDTQTVHRLEVLADDQWHDLPVGDVLHVAARTESSVDVWFQHDHGRPAPRPRRFRIFGTGQPLPAGVAHVDTAVTPSGTFVWHLFEEVQ